MNIVPTKVYLHVKHQSLAQSSATKVKIPLKLLIAGFTVLWTLLACSSQESLPEIEQENLVFQAQLPTWWRDWRNRSEESRQNLQRMFRHANLKNANRAFERVLDNYSEDAEIDGLAKKAKDKDDFEKTLQPLFFNKNIALVSEGFIAAGDNVVNRFHAIHYESHDMALEKRVVRSPVKTTRSSQVKNPLMKTCKSDSTKNFAIWGQSFTHVENGHIQYQVLDLKHSCKDLRYAQLSGKAAQHQQKMQAFADQLVAGMSAIQQQVDTRLSSVESLFLADAQVYGVAEEEAGLEAYQDYLVVLWQAFPDLEYRLRHVVIVDDYLAIGYQATGSHQESWYGLAADKQPVSMRGEMILQFNKAGEVEKAWVYDHLRDLD